MDDLLSQNDDLADARELEKLLEEVNEELRNSSQGDVDIAELLALCNSGADNNTDAQGLNKYARSLGSDIERALRSSTGDLEGTGAVSTEKGHSETKDGMLMDEEDSDTDMREIMDMLASEGGLVVQQVDVDNDKGDGDTNSLHERASSSSIDTKCDSNKKSVKSIDEGAPASSHGLMNHDNECNVKVPDTETLALSSNNKGNDERETGNLSKETLNLDDHINYGSSKGEVKDLAEEVHSPSYNINSLSGVEINKKEQDKIESGRLEVLAPIEINNDEKNETYGSKEGPEGKVASSLVHNSNYVDEGNNEDKSTKPNSIHVEVDTDKGGMHSLYCQDTGSIENKGSETNIISSKEQQEVVSSDLHQINEEIYSDDIFNFDDDQYNALSEDSNSNSELGFPNDSDMTSASVQNKSQEEAGEQDLLTCDHLKRNCDDCPSPKNAEKIKVNDTEVINVSSTQSVLKEEALVPSKHYSDASFDSGGGQVNLREDLPDKGSSGPKCLSNKSNVDGDSGNDVSKSHCIERSSEKSVDEHKRSEGFSHVSSAQVQNYEDNTVRQGHEGNQACFNDVTHEMNQRSNVPCDKYYDHPCEGAQSSKFVPTTNLRADIHGLTGSIDNTVQETLQRKMGTVDFHMNLEKKGDFVQKYVGMSPKALHAEVFSASGKDIRSIVNSDSMIAKVKRDSKDVHSPGSKEWRGLNGVKSNDSPLPHGKTIYSYFSSLQRQDTKYMSNAWDKQYDSGPRGDRFSSKGKQQQQDSNRAGGSVHTRKLSNATVSSSRVQPFVSRIGKSDRNRNCRMSDVKSQIDDFRHSTMSVRVPSSTVLHKMDKHCTGTASKSKFKFTYKPLDSFSAICTRPSTSDHKSFTALSKRSSEILNMKKKDPVARTRNAITDIRKSYQPEKNDLLNKKKIYDKQIEELGYVPSSIDDCVEDIFIKRILKSAIDEADRENEKLGNSFKFSPFTVATIKGAIILYKKKYERERYYQEDSNDYVVNNDILSDEEPPDSAFDMFDSMLGARSASRF